jgi:GST-like protein
MKAAIVLEELVELNRTSGLDFNYEPHTVNIRTGENRKPDFLALTPNAKIPVVFDPHGNENSQIRLFESGAILLYLAEKYGELLPKDVSCRYETIQWLFWASTSFSAQVKLFGFYYKHCVHKLPYCIARYSKEVDRLLAVLEFQLSHDLHFLTGEMYTIADIAAWPWVHALFENYDNAVAVRARSRCFYYLIVFGSYRSWLPYSMH